MPTVELDDETHALVRFGAGLLGLSEAEFVARAVRAMSGSQSAPQPARELPLRHDPWQPIELYGDYEGHRVGAQYLAATGRLTITTEPLAGQAFPSPSAAARAVIAALNPARAATQANGWRFWRIAATRERLDSLR